MNVINNESNGLMLNPTFYDQVLITSYSGFELRIPQDRFIKYVSGLMSSNDVKLVKGFIPLQIQGINDLAQYIRGRQFNNHFNDKSVIIGNEKTINPERAVLVSQNVPAEVKEELFKRDFGKWTKPYTVLDKDGNTILYIGQNTITSGYSIYNFTAFNVTGPLYEAFLLVTGRFAELNEKTKTDDESLKRLLNLGTMHRISESKWSENGITGSFREKEAAAHACRKLLERIKNIQEL